MGGSVHTNRSHIRARALCLLHYPSLGFFWAKNCKMSIIVRDKIALLHYPKSRSFQKIIVKKSNSWTQNFHFFHTSIKLQYAVTKPSDILIFGLRNIELVKCSQLKSEGAHFFSTHSYGAFKCECICIYFPLLISWIITMRFFFLMNERGAGATICGLSPIT